MKNIIAYIVCILLTSCSSFDKTEALSKNKLEIGVSKKEQVTQEIGLPNKVDHKDKTEYWYYLSDALNVSYFIPVPLSATATNGANAGKNYNVYGSKPLPNGTYNIDYANIGPTINKDFNPKLICVFDENGLLINVIKQENKGQ